MEQPLILREKILQIQQLFIKWLRHAASFGLNENAAVIENALLYTLEQGSIQVILVTEQNLL